MKRLLIQLLQDNPAIDLTDDEVDTIVEQVLLQHLYVLLHQEFCEPEPFRRSLCSCALCRNSKGLASY